MKKKNYSFIMLLIIFVSAGYVYYLINNFTDDGVTSTSLNDVTVIVSKKSKKSPILRAPKLKKYKARLMTEITPNEIQSLLYSFPKKKKVKEESLDNPHSTPKSLLTFAKNLGPVMNKAFKNENDLKALLIVLSDCALDDNVANAARALCVQNTERLAEYFPRVKKTAFLLRSNVSPEVQKILDTSDSFIAR